jgi:hypothetical protein
MERESPREETRRLRLDLHFVTSTFATRFTVIIDISCPYGRISHGKNAPQKVCVDRLKKSGILARELKADRDISMAIIPVIVSPLGAVHEQSLKDLSLLFMCR